MLFLVSRRYFDDFRNVVCQQITAQCLSSLVFIPRPEQIQAFSKYKVGRYKPCRRTVY